MNITSDTHHAELLDEKNDIRLYELIPYDGEPEKKRFYVARWNYDRCQLESVVPTDLGAEGGIWVYRGCNADAIRYVAHKRTRDNARRWFRKMSNLYEKC